MPMTPAIRKFLRWSVLVVALAFVVVLLGILPINAGFLRGPVEDAVRDAVGLELSIGGPVKLRLGPWPAVTAGDLAMGDTAEDTILAIDSLRAKMSLATLLGGRIRVLELQADGIAVDYCSPFPEFPDAATEDDPPPSVAIDEIAITRVSVRCGPSHGSDPLELSLERILASAPHRESMQATATGAFAGMTFDLAASGGELDELIAAAKPFPVQATLSSDAAVIEATGHLLISPPGVSVDTEIDVRQTDVQAITSAFDVELPALGSLRANGRIRGDLEALEFVGFDGDLGASSFAFDATLNLSGDRLHAGLTGTLDPLDIAPFLDDEPLAQQPGPDPVDNDTDFSDALDNLDVMDVDFEVKASLLRGLPIDVRALEVHGQLTNGVVELQHLSADVLGGQLSANGRLDGQAECPELQLRARATDLDLATLNPLLSLDEPLDGSVDSASLEGSSCGTTLPAHRDSLRADAELVGARASLGDDALPFSARRVRLSSNPGERSQVRFLGSLLGEKVEATLAAGSLGALLGADTWPVNLDARGGGARLRADGRARLAPGQLLVDTKLRIDAAALGTLHAWTGGEPSAPMPLQASTRLRFDESQLVADDVAISLGESKIGGRMAWNYAQDPDLLDLRIRSESIDVAEIAAAFPPTAEQEASINRATREDSSAPPVRFALPPVDLDLAFDVIHAERLDIQNFRLSGRLRKGLIEEARISFLVEEEIALHGELDVDLRRLPARAKAEFSAENLNIGRVLQRLELADDLRLRADALELLVTSDGGTPKELLLKSVVRLDLRGFNWDIPKTVSDSDAVAADMLDVSLEQVRLTMTPNEPTTWSSSGSVGDMDVELWMRTPSLDETFGGTAELPITLVAAVDSDVVMIDTRIDRSAEERVVAHVSLSGEAITSQNRNLSELTSPLGDYQLQGDIVLSEGLLQMPSADMRLGSSRAEGRFDMDASGPRTRIDVAVHAPYLQTDDLLYWSSEMRGTEDSAEQANVSSESRGVLYLARDFLSRFREDNDLDLRITVDELNAGPGHLGKGELRLYVDADDFILKPVTISLPGGGVNAEYMASTRNGRLNAGMRINADALVYGGLLRLADPESEARGLLYVDVDINADTELPPDAIPLDLLFANAAGSASVAAWPENIEAGVLDLWSANLVFALLPKSKTGEPSRLNCLVTRFDIEDGLMKSRTALLDTTDTIIRGRGTINLAQDELDLLVWPQAKREKFLSVSTPITVTGTFDDFRMGVEPAGFIGTVIRWYTSLIYVPYKWLTGKRFPPDGTPTCFDAMEWELTPELYDYFQKRDFSAPPSLP